VLPDAQTSEILINGQKLYEGTQVDNSVELTLGAGSYKIEYLLWEKDIHAQLEDSSPVSI
jgi:hypothetical protein